MADQYQTLNILSKYWTLTILTSSPDDDGTPSIGCSSWWSIISPHGSSSDEWHL